MSIRDCINKIKCINDNVGEKLSQHKKPEKYNKFNRKLVICIRLLNDVNLSILQVKHYLKLYEKSVNKSEEDGCIIRVNTENE